MADGDRLHKFRNRSAAGAQGLPPNGKKHSWWDQLLEQVTGQSGRRRPQRSLANTVLETSPSDLGARGRTTPPPADPRRGNSPVPNLSPDLPTFSQGGRQKIKPLQVTGTSLTLPRQRFGGQTGGRDSQRKGAKRPASGFSPEGRQPTGPSAYRRSPQSPPFPQSRQPDGASSPAPQVTLKSRSGPATSPLRGAAARAQHRVRPPEKLGRRRNSNNPTKKNRPPRSGKVQAMVYALRLLILSVGVGVLAGTLLSVWDPASRPVANNSQQMVMATPSPTPDALSQLTTRGSEIQVLKTAIQALAFKTPQLAPGVFVLDLNTNAYLDLGGSTIFAAASTIKLPVLIAFFQDVDAGKLKLEEMLTLSQTAIAKESGDLQYQPVGTQISALETAVRMITVSDNTATNMLIERLGGKESLTARFKSWGLSATVLNNLLADVEGTNTTTAKEMAWLLAQINQGNLVSMVSRDRILDIMRQTQSTGLLPNGLGPEAKIAHKTGTLSALLADVGVVDLPNGKRYAIAVLVKRPPQDEAATELIRQISKVTYDYFTQPQTASAPAALSPSPGSAGMNPGMNPGINPSIPSPTPLPQQR